MADGSPAGEQLLGSKDYEGTAADVWSCGVILFELFAGYLPFDDRNLMVPYRKIGQADYKFPHWLTESQKQLISRILDPTPMRRIAILGITEDKWFQTDYKPSCRYECDKKIYLDGVNAAFESTELLSNETIKKLEAAAMDVSLLVGKMNNFTMKMHPNQKKKMTRCARSYYNLSAEAIKVAPTNCVVQISKTCREA